MESYMCNVYCQEGVRVGTSDAELVIGIIGAPQAYHIVYKWVVHLKKITHFYLQAITTCKCIYPL